VDTFWKEVIWQQFGASIDMLENAIHACPEKLWGDRTRRAEYWYIVSHTLFWLDYYLSDSIEDFKPPEPFGLEELDPKGVMPPRVYSKEELLTYLEHGREKCRAVIDGLTNEKARQPSPGRAQLSVYEHLLYSMRHVQHHTAQLNLILRETIDSAPRWVGRARSPLR
jgi:hypothetical protein